MVASFHGSVGLGMVCSGVGSVDAEKVTQSTVHGGGELSVSVIVKVEWCAVFVDPFMDYDISHDHGFFDGHCSAFNPFSKVVLHHDCKLIPTFSPV